MNLVQKWLGNVLGLNIASGPFPLYVSQEYFGDKQPQLLDDKSGTYLEAGFGGSATIYSIITHITQMGSAIPWKVQRWEGGKAVDVPQHELYDTLLEHPNAWMGWEDFVSEQLGFMCINGEALTYVNAPMDNGEILELIPLAPPLIGLKAGSRFEPIRGWFLVGKENEITFQPEQILHAKLFNPLSGSGAHTRGLSPMRAGLATMTEDHEAVLSSIKAFANQGPPGIIHREKGNQEDTPMTSTQATAIKNKIERDHQGSHNARKMIITDAVLSYKQIGLSPVDLNILQQRQYTRGELCNLYHFPVELLNDNSASTYNNLTEMHKAAYLHAVIPLLYKLRGALNKGLQRAYGKDIWITPDLSQVEVLQQNKKDMTEWLSKAWWIKGTRKQEMMGEEMDMALDYYADVNGKPLQTPDEAREAALGGPQIAPMEDEEEEELRRVPAMRVAKELGLELSDYVVKANGNGKH